MFMVCFIYSNPVGSFNTLRKHSSSVTVQSCQADTKNEIISPADMIEIMVADHIEIKKTGTRADVKGRSVSVLCMVNY